MVPGKRKGHYEVIDGGNRLQAIGLIREGAKDAFTTVNCVVYQGDAAEAAALTANETRSKMEMIDRRLSVASALASGKTVETVAAMLGESELFVRQGRKLAALAPDILDQVKNEAANAAISLSCRRVRGVNRANLKVREFNFDHSLLLSRGYHGLGDGRGAQGTPHR